MGQDTKKKDGKSAFMSAFRKTMIVGLAIVATKTTMMMDEHTNDQYGPNKSPVIGDLVLAEQKWKCGDDCQSFSDYMNAQAQAKTPHKTYTAINQMLELPVGQRMVQHAHDTNITMRANDPEFKKSEHFHGLFDGKTGTFSYHSGEGVSMREALSVTWHELHHMHQFSQGLEVLSMKSNKTFTPKETFLAMMVQEVSSYTFDKIMMHRYHLAGAPGMNAEEKQDLKDFVKDFSDFYQEQIRQGVKPQEAEKITAQALFRYHVQADEFHKIRGDYIRRKAPGQGEMMKPVTDALKVSDLQKLATIPGEYSFLPPEFSVQAFDAQIIKDLQKNWNAYAAKQALQEPSSEGAAAEQPAMIEEPTTAQICFNGPEPEIKKIGRLVQNQIKQGL